MGDEIPRMNRGDHSITRRPTTDLAGIPDRCPEPSSGLARALDRISDEIREGVRHGYCDYRITCEIVGLGKRRLILHAGKSFLFVIGANELDRSDGDRDPHHEGANQSNV
jgi:hypothetical protein